MSELSQLSPTLLWRFFDTICSIPHPSKHEAALCSWIRNWAAEQHISVDSDAVGNLILRKPATPGMEDRKGVILQAHLDMVPQANADSGHDFTRDPIRPRIDGEWVRATGTTLGADNGIGAAACLAVLADNTLQHGPLEVLLTIDEEAGMTGAFNLAPGLLQGEILLNTDSEQDGEVYMGCAGGIDATARFHFQPQAVAADQVALRLAIKGLRGGHSGVNIHQGRGNANQLLARLLTTTAEFTPFALASLSGGTLRNAIPREAEAVIVLNDDDAAALPAQLAPAIAALQRELLEIDANLQITLELCATPAEVLDADTQRRLLAALIACPNGVIRMSQAITGVVETSTNLGVIRTEGHSVFIQCLIRSLNDAGRRHVEQMVSQLFTLAGAEIELAGAYPGWAPDPHSPIMHQLRATHEQLFGSAPHIMVIHAGLECGLFKASYPHWDMVSFGPTIQGAHSPDEKVHIPAVERFWQLLTRLLAEIPRRDAA